MCTLLLGWVMGLAGCGLYHLGGIDKANEIVYNCRDYGKYVVSENWQITCNGPYNPIYLMPEYTKENGYASRKGKLKESNWR